VERVLFFVRFGQDTLAYRFRESDVGMLISSAVEVFRSRFTGSTAPDIRVEIKSGLPKGRIDESAMTQVILNLLDNAWKYGQPPSRGSSGVPGRPEDGGQKTDKDGKISNIEYPISKAQGNIQPSFAKASEGKHSSKEKSEAHHPESCISDPASGHSHTPIPRYADTPLLLITGPLALDWRRRKWGILPRLENGEISGRNWPTAERMDLWVKQHIHVQGRPDWVFAKVHTHGYMLSNREVLLGESMRRLHEYLSSQYNDGKEWFLHYVTAREMCNIVRAAEDGKAGNPGEFRDYEIAPPPCVRRED
jgi:hypothetical protein